MIKPLANEYKAISNGAFFALQLAIRSYPSDEVRQNLHRLLSQYSASDDIRSKLNCIQESADWLSKNIMYVDYVIWDYSLVASVASKEFRSWSDGIQESISSDSPLEDTDSFQERMGSYAVVTIVLLSQSPALSNWLAFYTETLHSNTHFERRTIQAILNKLAKGQASILRSCTNTLFMVLPDNPERFYSAKRLVEESEWGYLRPMY
jgi:hypothetical protein